MALFEGGAPLPVTTGGTGITEGRTAAVPVYVVQGGQAPIGQRARRVVVVTSGPIEGGAARPVYDAGAGALYSNEAALPVFVVAGGGSLAPAVDPAMVYTNKAKAVAPANLIAYWPQAESSGTVLTDESGNARHGTYTAVTLGATGIGDGRTSASYNGTTSFGNIYSASLNAAFTPLEFTVMAWGQMSAAGVWTDGALHRLLRLRADASNDIGLYKNTTNNQLVAQYSAGGTVKTVAVTTSTLGWFLFGMTVSKSGDAMKVYYADSVTPFAQSGATVTGLGVWAGALANTVCCIGAGSTGPTNVWSGLAAHVPVWNTPLSSAQLATLAAVP